MRQLFFTIFFMFCLTVSLSSQMKKGGAATKPKTAQSQTKPKATTQVNPKTKTTVKTAPQTKPTKKTTPQPRATTNKMQTPTVQISTKELEQQRRKALEDLEFTESLLKETKADAQSSLNKLNLISQQLESRRKLVTLLNQEIASIDLDIDSAKKEIDALNQNLKKIRGDYARSMAQQQRELHSAQYKLLVILSAENLAQSYRRMRYLREYSDWKKREAGKIKSQQNIINKKQAELAKTRKGKETLLAQREEESKKIASEETEQKTVVQQLSQKQKELRQQVDKKRQEAEALDRQIEQLIAEEMNKIQAAEPEPATIAGNKIKAPNPKTETNKNKDNSRKENVIKETNPPPTSTTEVKLTNRTNEKDFAISGNFAKNKGRLPYPLNGRYTIISRFGQQQHKELSYVKTNNNGIDIRTTAGVDARAVFKGVVTRVFVMPGYNNNVIVRHGNYVTVYCNLGQVYVKAGDVVQAKQAIGKIFTDTANGNATVLHFEIWKERVKLNPIHWLH